MQTKNLVFSVGHPVFKSAFPDINQSILQKGILFSNSEFNLRAQVENIIKYSSFES